MKEKNRRGWSCFRVWNNDSDYLPRCKGKTSILCLLRRGSMSVSIHPKLQAQRWGFLLFMGLIYPPHCIFCAMERTLIKGRAKQNSPLWVISLLFQSGAGFPSVLAIFLFGVAKIPNIGNWGKRWFILAHSLRLQSFVVGKPLWQEHEAAGHIVVRKQKKMNVVPPTFRVGILISVTPCWKCPHVHTQSYAPVMILTLVKLTMKSNPITQLLWARIPKL